MWLQPYSTIDYEIKEFKDDIASMWDNLKDLYEKLHAYVRFRLNKLEEYSRLVGTTKKDHLPAHILGILNDLIKFLIFRILLYLLSNSYYTKFLGA